MTRLLDENVLSEAQAREVLDIHQRNRTPLFAILGAMDYVNVGDYASRLAEIEETGYISKLIGSENFFCDEDFVRRFEPALMMRYLFCPLHLTDDMVVVLAVNPEEPVIAQVVEQVVPDVEILPMIGTEIDVTRLINQIFGPQFSYNAVNALRENRPRESGARVFTQAQLIVIGLLIAGLVAGLIFDFWRTLGLLIIVISLVYVMGVFYKVAISLTGMLPLRAGARIEKDDLAALDDADLPIYSILVPVYKEPQVVPRLLKALSNIDYPLEKLDVLLLMEEDDLETIAQARAANPPSFFRFIIVPESHPRTKPKACNYGLYFCRGEYVTIYDAEDIPEPDQLKKAVAAFRRGDDDLICVQARLNYFNSRENYLTVMFTLEYTYWFDCLLPGLDRLSLPIPLGGTSNHFKLDKLWELGAWDPFNVTEDADLGIRASARGYTVGVISSTTYEEANKAVGNWIRQRSRWIKGYMQTWLVHNRRPLSLLRQLGLKDWLSYQFFIGGTAAIFLLNPVMWTLFIVWLAFEPDWLNVLFQGWVWYLAVFSLVVGNLLAIFLNVLAVLRRRQDGLLLLSFTNPLYWMLHSIAAYMALWQLITNPFYWEKTNHGLTEIDPDHDQLFTVGDGRDAPPYPL